MSKFLIGSKYRSKGRHVIFAVIDINQSSEYPKNFVCILPKQINLRSKNQNKFVKLFGKESVNIAKRLLLKLQSSEEDPNVSRVIKQRLKLLDSASIVNFKCHSCGVLFEPDDEEIVNQTIRLDCKKRYMVNRKRIN